MAVETPVRPNHEAELKKEFVDARIKEYKDRRWSGLWTSSILKTTGFLALLAGAIAAFGSTALAPGIAAGEVVRRLGNVAMGIGGAVLGTGLIKESYNEKKKP